MIVSSFQWDLEDPKLLVCHLKPVPVSKDNKEAGSKESAIVVLWTSSEKGVLLHEVRIVDKSKTIIKFKKRKGKTYYIQIKKVRCQKIL